MATFVLHNVLGVKTLTFVYRFGSDRGLAVRRCTRLTGNFRSIDQSTKRTRRAPPVSLVRKRYNGIGIQYIISTADYYGRGHGEGGVDWCGGQVRVFV